MKKPKSIQKNTSTNSKASQTVTGQDIEWRRRGRLATANWLKRGRTPLHVLESVEQANALAQEAIGQAMAAEPPDKPSACMEGCAWCCYQRVGASAAEVLRIANYLRQSLTPADLQAALDRVLRLDDEGRRPSHQRAKARPCSLLVDNRCSVYPVRPLTCRGFNSTDARQCELSLDPKNHATVPAYGPQRRICTLVLDGLLAGLTESELNGDLLELTRALRIALTAPDAQAQWLTGKPIFASARMA